MDPAPRNLSISNLTFEKHISNVVQSCFVIWKNLKEHFLLSVKSWGGHLCFNSFVAGLLKLFILLFEQHIDDIFQTENPAAHLLTNAERQAHISLVSPSLKLVNRHF